jgi:hypothetical protein
VKQVRLAIWLSLANIALVDKVIFVMRHKVLAAVLVAALPGLLVAGPGAAHAQSPAPVRAVIELFTSQGCSSCPPADALLKTYAESGDVMALSLPVDYWDYIGWKDTFASPRNTERQRAYAKRFDIGPVYTPQVVINGTSQAVGSNRQEIDFAIEQTAAAFAARRVPVRFWRQESSFVIEAGPAADGAEVREATIWLAVLQKSGDVAIKRGENGGRTLTYTNIVRQMTPVGLWNGKPAVIQLAQTAVMSPESEDLVVLVQEADTGPIIGAARLGQ